MEDVKEGNFAPNIVKEGKIPVDFSAVALTQYGDYETVSYPSISRVLEEYYACLLYTSIPPQ